MIRRVLVVDGVEERRSELRYQVERSGYLVESCTPAGVVNAVRERRPGALLVAMDLPEQSGIDLCHTLRMYPEVSDLAMVLVAEGEMCKDKESLDCNIDGWVSLPLAPGEIEVALEKAMRRRADSDHQPESSDNTIIINVSAMTLAVRGKEISTTPLEFRLIDYLAHHRGQVFTRDALLDAVWGDLLFVTPRSVDSCVRRLRRKLQPEEYAPTFLKTIRGIGYKLEANAVWKADESCRCASCADAQERKRQRGSSP